MALTLTIVDQQYISPPTVGFSASVTVNVSAGSGTGRAVLAFVIMDRDSATSTPQTCRFGSTSGSGGTLMTAGTTTPMITATNNSARLFYLESPSPTGAGIEVWATMGDGSAKPGLLVVVVQSDDGSALTVGDLTTQTVQAGSGAQTYSIGSPSTDAVGVLFVRNNGAVVATASSGNSLLATGQTDGTNITVDSIQKPGTGSALSVGWVPGDNFQWQSRHGLSLTKAGGGGGSANGAALYYYTQHQ